MKNQIFIIGSGFSKDFNEHFPILTNLTDSILQQLIEHGAVERNGIIFDISLSKIETARTIKWQRTPSTIQNLVNKLAYKLA